MCNDTICSQTWQYIKHVTQCPHIRGLEEGAGKCELAGCRTTYVLLAHLLKHNQISESQLPDGLLRGEVGAAAAGRLSESSSTSSSSSSGSRTEHDRSTSFDSTDSEGGKGCSPPTSPTDGTRKRCLLCALFQAADTEQERVILNAYAATQCRGSGKAKAVPAAGYGAGGPDQDQRNCPSNASASPTRALRAEEQARRVQIQVQAQRLVAYWRRHVKESSVITNIANYLPFTHAHGSVRVRIGNRARGSSTGTTGDSSDIGTDQPETDQQEPNSVYVYVYDMPMPQDGKGGDDSNTPCSHVQVADIDMADVKEMYTKQVHSHSPTSPTSSASTARSSAAVTEPTSGTKRPRSLTLVSAGDAGEGICDDGDGDSEAYMANTSSFKNVRYSPKRTEAETEAGLGPMGKGARFR